MKKKMLLVITINLVILFCFIVNLNATNLLTENFDYNIGDNITDHGWYKHTAGDPIVISSPGLSYTGYVCSGIGNAAEISGSGENDNRTFSTQTSGSIYVSFMVKFNDASYSEDKYLIYFVRSFDSSTYRGKFFVKRESSLSTKLRFGISKLSAFPDETTGYNYDTGTTYLIVMKLTFITGTSNDQVDLWINPDLSGPEPLSNLNTTNGTDTSQLSAIEIRQESNVDAIIDGIRVGTTWYDTTLPVILSTFTAQYLNNVPTLYWVTQSETDNIGWYIYRNTQNDFITSMIISDLIPGFGTTTEPHSYIYEDYIENAFPGDTYWYWLESIDFGGMINHYDKVAHIVIPENYDPGNENPEEFEEFGLFQSNPNPFNPQKEETTEISFNLKEQAYVEINIYNIKGELIKTIYDGFNTADEAGWDGKDENGNLQATGIYLYELKVNNKLYSTKRMILIR